MDDARGLSRSEIETAKLFGIAPALAKALNDPFDYVLGTRDGRIVRFTQATMEPGDEWIFIHGFGSWADHGMEGQNFTFERGLYVRVSDIVWVSDAPMGS